MKNTFPDIMKGIMKAYNAIIVNKKFEAYDGVMLTSSKLLATSQNIDVQLNKRNLEYSRKEQGRSHVESVMACAVQLGIQQGLDIAREEEIRLIKSLQSSIRMIEMSMKTMQSTKATADEIVADVQECLAIMKMEVDRER
jgi:hypothetical protein